jgi:hypothetical protein
MNLFLIGTIGTCLLYEITSDFSGNISISNCFIVLYEICNAVCKQSSESEL